MVAIRRAKFSSVKRVMKATQAEISKAQRVIIKTPIQTPTHNRSER
jgi:hypothetical protein